MCPIRLRESEDYPRSVAGATQDLLWTASLDAAGDPRAATVEAIYGIDRHEALAGDGGRPRLDLVVP
ncbi:hypothetical protein D1122_13945 [Cereibacter sphaeroides]|nr:hypothetical protein D1122_13945 [Cereibacter sphaeroides]